MPAIDRLEALERQTERLTERLARLEARLGDEAPQRTPVPDPLATAERARAQRAPAPPRPEPPAARPPRPAPQVPAARPALEDLLGGRVLAWAGGLAVLVGIVLLFAVAVSRGWIGEGARTLMGGAASLALVAAGAWLQERRRHTDAAVAAAAAGLGGLFVTAIVASRLYELVPVSAGLALTLATGSLATLLALRWRATGIAALGILGGLLAPVLVGAPQDGATTAVLLVASLSAAAVCVRERWDWLGLAAFAVVTPQWLAYVASDPETGATVATLAAFGAVAAASAAGFEIRERSTTVRPMAVALLTLNAVVLGGVGWLALDESATWLVGLAAAHVGLGLLLLAQPRASRAVGVVACALGTVLADCALAQLLDGVVLTAAWAAVAAAFAPLLRLVAPGGLDEVAAGAALGTHLALALGHVLLIDAPPEAVAAGADVSTAGALAIAATAAACFSSGAVLAGRDGWRFALYLLGLGAVAYLLTATLAGAVLVCAFAGLSVALAEAARRRHGDLALGCGAIGLLALAVGHSLALEAPPAALVERLAGPTAALVALLACALAAWRCAAAAAEWAQAARLAEAGGVEPALSPSDLRAGTIALAATGALVLLHLASVQLVTAAGAGPRAQALLSALWGLAGVAALIAGLVRDVPALRTGALALLAAALAKVFLYDLSTLTPIARVASFIVLGLLLLIGSFAWQRIRPRPLPDRSEAPGAPG